MRAAGEGQGPAPGAAVRRRDRRARIRGCGDLHHLPRARRRADRGQGGRADDRAQVRHVRPPRGGPGAGGEEDLPRGGGPARSREARCDLVGPPHAPQGRPGGHPLHLGVHAERGAPEDAAPPAEPPAENPGRVAHAGARDLQAALADLPPRVQGSRRVRRRPRGLHVLHGRERARQARGAAARLQGAHHPADLRRPELPTATGTRPAGTSRGGSTTPTS